MKAAPKTGLFRGPYRAAQLPVGVNGFVTLDHPGVRADGVIKPFTAFVMQIPLSSFGEGAQKLGDLACTRFGNKKPLPKHFENTAALLGLITRPLAELPAVKDRGQSGMPAVYKSATHGVQPRTATLIELLLGQPEGPADGDAAGSSGASSSSVGTAATAATRVCPVALRVWVLQIDPALKMSEVVGRQLSFNDRTRAAKKRKLDEALHDIGGAKGQRPAAKTTTPQKRKSVAPPAVAQNPMTSRHRVFNTSDYVDALRGYASKDGVNVDWLTCGHLDAYVAELGAGARLTPLLEAALDPRANGYDIASHALGPEHTIRASLQRPHALLANVTELGILPGMRDLDRYLLEDAMKFPRRRLVWALAGEEDPLQVQLPDPVKRAIRNAHAQTGGCAGLLHPDEREAGCDGFVRYEALPSLQLSS